MTISHTLEEIERELLREEFSKEMQRSKYGGRFKFEHVESMANWWISHWRLSHIQLLEAVVGEVESIGGIANIYDDSLFISKFIVLSILQSTIDDIKKENI